MKKKPRPSCYMCDAPFASREHVPPVCIFPGESKYRKNLITVSSCKAHNADKSTDDVLLQSLLVFGQNANELAFSILDQEVMPRLEAKPHLLPVFLPNIRPLGGSLGAAMSIDLGRFEASICSIVRALFYFESNSRAKLLDELIVVWPALKERRRLTEPAYYHLVRAWDRGLPPLDRGANPRVFQYRFDYHPDGTYGMCRMRFYEGTPIYVLWEMKSKSAQPDN